MGVYIALLVWVIVCSGLQRINVRVSRGKVVLGKDVYLFFTFLAIWIIMAFRAPTIGTDTYAYSGYFLNFASMGSFFEAVNAEGISSICFNGLSYILGQVSASRQFYVFWTASFILIGMAMYIHYASKWPAVSVFLFLTFNLFFTSMNAGRQWMATVLILNAFLFLYRNFKDKLGWILLALSIGMHSAALVFLPAIIGMYIVKKRGLSKRVYIETIIVSVLALAMFGMLTTVFSTYFTHYEMYVSGSNADNLIENTGSGKIVVQYIADLIVLLIFGVARKKNKGERVRNNLIDSTIPGAIFCVIVGIFFFKNNLVNRMLYPYQCSFLIIIPYVFAHFEKRSRLILYVIMGIGLTGSYFLWMNSNLGDIIPYQFGSWNY